MTASTDSSLFTHYVTNRHRLPLRTRIIATYGAVVLLHLLAAGLLLSALAPGARPLSIGIVVAAYVAGLKHSYDWDHISAIDNSTRKLVADGMSPASVGFAFSLGHSLVVTLAGIMVVGGAQFISGAFEEGNPVNHVLGLIGAAVSGFYLLILGLYNGGTATRLIRRLRRHESPAEAGHTHHLSDENWGLVSRILRKPISKIERPRDIFVIGFLFGLGFDTATTVGLLVLTVSASLAGVPPLALIGLPIAFTAAMTLCDTTNGLGMMKLYSTATEKSERRLRFNAVITSISALSALFISIITLGGFFNELFSLTDPVTTWLAEIDLGNAGLALVALFVAVWLWFYFSGRMTRGKQV